MFRDFVTLARLEWKRGKYTVIEALRLIGFEPKGSRLYRLYFWLFWAFWLFTLWSFSVEQIYQFSRILPAATAARLFMGVPALIFGLQLLYLAVVLQDEPLKLSEAALAYVAFSPVNRMSIVILGFVRALLLPAGFAAAISCLLAMLLTWRSAPNVVGAAGLAAGLAAAALVYFSAALAWALALAKIQLRRWMLRAMWLLLPLGVLAGILAPSVMLFPARLWQGAASLSLSVMDAVAFLIVFALAVAGLLAVGSRVHMSFIADASRTYARIRRLGLFGRWYAGDMTEQLRQQTKIAQSGRRAIRLSTQAIGYRALWNRAGVSLWRLPGSVLEPLLVGASLTAMVTTIARIDGTNSLQSWVLALLMLCVIRLKGVVVLFRQDTAQPFLRAMIPVNNLALFTADAAYSLVLTGIGSTAVILLQAWDAPLVVVLLELLGITALGLGQALELVEERLIIHRKIPFEYTVVIGGGVVIAVGLLSHSLWAAVATLVLLDGVLGVMLYRSRGG